MPIIKSAKKRVRVAKKATVRNRRTKRSLRSVLKSFDTSMSGANHAKAQSAIDQAVKKGVMHKNKAAREKSRLAAKAKASGKKLAGPKTSTKKQVAKKTSPKKPAAKKK